jgi:hypothetical protein
MAGRPWSGHPPTLTSPPDPPHHAASEPALLNFHQLRDTTPAMNFLPLSSKPSDTSISVKEAEGVVHAPWHRRGRKGEGRYGFGAPQRAPDQDRDGLGLPVPDRVPSGPPLPETRRRLLNVPPTAPQAARAVAIARPKSAAHHRSRPNPPRLVIPPVLTAKIPAQPSGCEKCELVSPSSCLKVAIAARLAPGPQALLRSISDHSPDGGARVATA